MKTILRFTALAFGLALGAAAAEERTSTVIQPPTPPGLPKPPAVRLPNPVVLPPPQSIGELIRTEKEPPAPREERTPIQAERPYADAVWVPGYYVWHGGDYVWVPGKWERPPEGRPVWVAPRWEQREGGRVFVEGYWRK